MRLNRVIRDQLSAQHGESIVPEIERWNDGALDSLGNYGVPVSLTEERLQSDMLELMAVEEAVYGS